MGIYIQKLVNILEIMSLFKCPMLYFFQFKMKMCFYLTILGNLLAAVLALNY